MTILLRYIIITVAALCAACPLLAAPLTFTGSADKVLEEKPEPSTGLNAIYVIYDTEGVTASYRASSDRKVTWYRYSNLGGGHAEEIACAKDGSNYSISLDSEDYGYIIEEGTDRFYCWIVNYKRHQLDLQRLDFDSEQECDRARVNLVGDASKITYFTINGAAKELSRDLKVDYTTLVYDETNETYAQTPATQTFSSIDHTMGIFAPLCDTRFTLTGDKFLTAWGMEESIESDTYSAIAVEAVTSATQLARDNDNEQVVEANLGGSAPIDITFRAAVTDAAIFREWQMSQDPEFEVVDLRFQDLEFDYTFRENGNTFVRFVANNAEGSCEYYGETYEVFVGDSGLLCPNVFSPNGDGVNDEWKVSYRSIIEYECHIFNRWGEEMMSSTDPAQGWDGKYKGKYVPTGAYYYVIKAKGSDGRKYNLNGSISIIKSNKQTGTTEQEN